MKASGGRVQIAVSDQGIGIEPDQQHSLFTRFGRVLTPDSSGIPGTGLGLYLSRQLARLHGGDIRVDSRPGKGSTFTLELPLAEPRPQPRAERRAGSQPGGRREIA